MPAVGDVYGGSHISGSDQAFLINYAQKKFLLAVCDIWLMRPMGPINCKSLSSIWLGVVGLLIWLVQTQTRIALPEQKSVKFGLRLFGQELGLGAEN